MNDWTPPTQEQIRQRRAECDARIAELERDAARYRVLRRSVLQAPMSAGFANMTTESDIDAQCDQIAAIDSQREG